LGRELAGAVGGDGCCEGVTGVAGWQEGGWVAWEGGREERFAFG
jgi:hypothetical protein